MWKQIFWILWIGAVTWEVFLHSLEWRHLIKMKLDPNTVFDSYVQESTVNDKNVDYAIEHLRISLGETLTNYLISAIIVAYDLPKLVDGLTAQISSPIFRAGAFGIAFGLLFWVSSFPWEWAKVFYVESKYKFNKTTKSIFIRDQAIVSSFIVLLSFLGFACFAAIFESRIWPLYLMFAFALFEIVAMILVPLVVIPLFFELNPLADEELIVKIDQLLGKLGINKIKVFVANASKRTLHSNAFVTGLGSNKKIVLFDTLVSSLTADEVIAVLLHELGHWKLSHALKRIGLILAIQAVLVYFAFVMSNVGFMYDFQIQNPQQFAIYAFLLLNMAVTLFFQPCLLNFIRRQEIKADLFAARHAGSSLMINALSKISTDNMAWLPRHFLYKAWYCTHPPIPERLKFLKAYCNV
ncbi:MULTISPECIES: M48 family metallopeptidase [Acetomicrobium]|uniref:M48 family metallopeptidase n=1 Tax=Acetomicrobium hydrogeniformans TaxID=649746 RepID=A0A7V7BYV0_9BACT|nr:MULTISPECIES: M48 family metallopeptidase [Acetomicrobium]HHZ04557.1 M48 family metallopeptidase [Acetomicrobium hydrogeniformans]